MGFLDIITIALLTACIFFPKQRAVFFPLSVFLSILTLSLVIPNKMINDILSDIFSLNAEVFSSKLQKYLSFRLPLAFCCFSVGLVGTTLNWEQLKGFMGIQSRNLAPKIESTVATGKAAVSTGIEHAKRLTEHIKEEKPQAGAIDQKTEWQKTPPAQMTELQNGNASAKVAKNNQPESGKLCPNSECLMVNNQEDKFCIKCGTRI